MVPKLKFENLKQANNDMLLYTHFRNGKPYYFNLFMDLKRTNTVVFVWLVLIHLKRYVCQNTSRYQDIITIKSELLSNYNTDAVPVPNIKTSLTVNVSLYVMALQNVDEKTQVLTTSVFWMVKWQDFIFKWNDSKYDVDRMTVRIKDVWVPDFFVVNSVNDMRMSGLKDGEYVNVNADGCMKWFPSSELMTSCFVDVSKFPFDVQVCSIRIESWYHDGRDFTLKHGIPGIEISSIHFFENGEWEIQNLTSEEYKYVNYIDSSIFYTGIEYKITLKRRSSYHILTTIFPFFILMFLNTVSTIVPTECGEKLGFCMSQFLSMIVFLTLVAQSMPVSSLTISYFALIIGSQILISSFSAFIVAACIFIQGKPENSSPPLLLTVVLMPYAYFCFGQKSRLRYNMGMENITWDMLNKKLNFILKVTLYLNVVGCFGVLGVLVWSPSD